MTYYCLSHMTGMGYEELLDSVDGSLIVWFIDGWAFGIRPNDGPIVCVGQDVVDTLIAA